MTNALNFSSFLFHCRQETISWRCHWLEDWSNVHQYEQPDRRKAESQGSSPCDWSAAVLDDSLQNLRYACSCHWRWGCSRCHWTGHGWAVLETQEIEEKEDGRMNDMERFINVWKQCLCISIFVFDRTIGQNKKKSFCFNFSFLIIKRHQLGVLIATHFIRTRVRLQKQSRPAMVRFLVHCWSTVWRYREPLWQTVTNCYRF